MNTKTTIELSSLVRMIDAENRAEAARYRFEIDSPLSRIVENADALGPLTFKEKIDLTRWKLGGDFFYSRFRPGDGVEIRTKVLNADRSENLSYDWTVESITYPLPGKIEVVVRGDKPLDATALSEVFLFKSSSSKFNNLLKQKLEEVSYTTAPILGNGNYSLATGGSKVKNLYENLNKSQKAAIEYLIENNLNGAIQGPPGTGKTHLLQAVIAIALDSNMKVGVTSFTNTAVDNLLGSVIGAESEYDWVRMGELHRVRRDHYKIEHLNLAARFSAEINKSNLIGATMHKFAYSHRSAPQFDLLVIDEAGQMPIYFWPFIQRLARRVILVGDQFQLPPVLAVEHPIPYDNVFSLLINSETPMLETQYRMRREIQAWSSEKFYKGRLAPHTSVIDRDFFTGHLAFLTDGFVVPREFESASPGKSSKPEADFIADKVEKLQRGNTSLEKVGVICPYRAQAGIVNAILQNRLGVEQASKVLVDTVERFQGQEREAIFLSFGSSNANEDELKFLSDPKRLNVSITRARSRFYCLFDSKLWRRSRGGRSEDLNEFLRWVKDEKTAIKRAA